MHIVYKYTLRVIWVEIHMLFFMFLACMTKSETTQPRFYSKIDGPFGSHKTSTYCWGNSPDAEGSCLTLGWNRKRVTIPARTGLILFTSLITGVRICYNLHNLQPKKDANLHIFQDAWWFFRIFSTIFQLFNIFLVASRQQPVISRILGASSKSMKVFFTTM